MAIKSQNEAARAEQQRIKNLVLNYDLQESSVDHDGINAEFSSCFLRHNPNLPKNYFDPIEPPAHFDIQGLSGEKHQHNASLQQTANHANARLPDKSGGHRGQRARKLQLSDVDWYELKTERPDLKPASRPGRGGRGRVSKFHKVYG